MKIKALSLLAILLCGVIFADAFAGSLEPTAAPGPTMKTLDEVEPRIPIPGGTGMGTRYISTPGSYYLTGDRSTPSSMSYSIYISTSHVTIDLMGYTLTGPGSGTNYGIKINTDCNNVEIRNGTIRNFGQHGIYSSAASSYDIRVIDVRAIGNLGYGVYLQGYGSKAENCTARDNGGSGIYANTGSVVSGCVAHDNGGYGMYAGTGSVVTRCVFYGNNGAGIYTGFGSSIAGCTSSGNLDYGINTGAGCTIVDCASYNNSAYGIYTNSGCSVNNCTSHSNTSTGIWAGTGSTISDCTSYDNGNVGIQTNSEGIISRCTVYSNNIGISAGVRSAVSGCTVVRNDDDGIYLNGAYCTVVGNNCGYNGQTVADGAGIRSGTTNGHIESNTVNNNDYGIALTSTGNFVIKNSATANTTGNYSIAAGNAYGQIIDVAGDGSIVSTDPWANFVH